MFLMVATNQVGRDISGITSVEYNLEAPPLQSTPNNKAPSISASIQRAIQRRAVASTRGSFQIQDSYMQQREQNRQREASDTPQKVPDPTIPPSSAVSDLPPGFCRTSSTGYELLLESLLGIIFREESLFFPAQGSILDVGAQFGEQACHFAKLNPHRKVYALDPSPSQVEAIASKFAKDLPNLIVKNVGVGGTPGTGVANDGFTGMKPGEKYTILTMDNLFFDRFEPLAFAHIDVEGRELEVLHGGNKTIQAYKPVFTAELRVHQNPEYSRQLLDYINKIGYDAYVIDEVCGWPHMDYRNLICFPRSRMDYMEFSDAFNFAMATEAIIPVNSKTIFDKVYPCCALGGTCCPYNSTDDKRCCHEKSMRKWHQQNNVKKPAILQGFTYSRNHVFSMWGALRKRSNMTPEQALA